MTPPVAGLVLSPATNGASAENGASNHFQTGGSVSQRADPPSQDRRSLADLVSSPPLATDHESRLHQLAGDAALKPQAAEGQRMDGWLGATA